MALKTLNGSSIWQPEVTDIFFPVSSGVATIDATGEKLAFIGNVFFNERTGTKNLSHIHIRFGTVVKAGGSALTFSVQDVDTANGPSGRPDEVQDQTFEITNANASFASNTVIRCTLSASRVVSNGDLLAFVLEFNGAGRLGADSVQLSSLILNNINHEGGYLILKTATWGNALARFPNILLEFDDGTFGNLEKSIAYSSLSTVAFKQDSATDEYALEFISPTRIKIDKAAFVVAMAANTSDFDLVLYRETTQLYSVSFDANRGSAAVGNQRWFRKQFSSEIEIIPNIKHYLSIKPTQITSTVTIPYFSVGNANHLSPLEGGVSWRLASRVDNGAWIADPLSRPFASIGISSLEDGSNLFLRTRPPRYNIQQERKRKIFIISGGTTTVNNIFTARRQLVTQNQYPVKRRNTFLSEVTTTNNIVTPRKKQFTYPVQQRKRISNVYSQTVQNNIIISRPRKVR